MELAVLFMVIGTVRLAFRKWIARQQYRIVSDMLRGKPHDDGVRVKAFEQASTLFSVLLLLAGASIAALHLVTGQ